MSDEITGQGPERSGINRRTVMKGAAWSVPVIVVASAAPAMAASGTFDLVPGSACKLPGNSCNNQGEGWPKSYVFYATTVNQTGLGGYLVLTSLSVVGDDPGFTLPPPTRQFPFTSTTGALIAVYAASTNSANAVFTITLGWTAYFTDGDTSTGVTSWTVNGTPPDCLCPPI